MTTERLSEIKARHIIEEGVLTKRCIFCCKAWPCDAIQALTAYEQAQQRIAELEASLAAARRNNTNCTELLNKAESDRDVFMSHMLHHDCKALRRPTAIKNKR